MYLECLAGTGSGVALTVTLLDGLMGPQCTFPGLPDSLSIMDSFPGFTLCSVF